MMIEWIGSLHVQYVFELQYLALYTIVFALTLYNKYGKVFKKNSRITDAKKGWKQVLTSNTVHFYIPNSR